MLGRFWYNNLIRASHYDICYCAHTHIYVAHITSKKNLDLHLVFILINSEYFPLSVIYMSFLATYMYEERKISDIDFNVMDTGLWIYIIINKHQLTAISIRIKVNLYSINCYKILL